MYIAVFFSFFNLDFCSDQDKKHTSIDKESFIEATNIKFDEKRKEIEVYSIKNYLESVESCKIIYPYKIFGFNHRLYKKIWDCRTGFSVLFTKTEIKKMISFGITVYETNTNISKTIFYSLMNGMYNFIMQDYLESLRSSLIKNAIIEILQEYDNMSKVHLLNRIESFEFLFLEENYKNTKESLFFTSKSKNIKEFSEIIYNGDNYDTNTFFKKLYRQIIDEIKKKSNIYFQNELDENFNNLFFDTFNEKFKIIFEKYVNIIKNFDLNIFVQNIKEKKNIKSKDVRKFMKFFSNQVSLFNNYENFIRENSKIFFSLDFLTNSFYDHCFENIPIMLVTKDDDIIKCNSKIIGSIIETLILRFENTYFMDILTNQYSKQVSVTKKFSELDSNFLLTISSLKNCDFMMKRSLFSEYDKNKIISLDFCTDFLIFFLNLDGKDHSISIDNFKTNYKSGKYICKTDYRFDYEISLCFIRYAIRKSYVPKKEFKYYESEEYIIYREFYKIFTPKINEYYVILSPLIKKEGDKISFQEKIIKKMNNFLLRKKNRKIKSFAFEANKDVIETSFRGLKRFNDRFLIFGEISFFNCDTFLDVYGIIIGNFYYMVFLYPSIEILNPQIYNLNFTLKNTEFTVNNFSLSTLSLFSINFYNYFFFTSKNLNTMDKKTIEIEDGKLYAEFVIFTIIAIPEQINSICIINSLETQPFHLTKITIHSGNFLESMVFINCHFQFMNGFFGEYLDILFKACYFDATISILKACEFTFLLFYDCFGIIIIFSLKFTSMEISYEPEININKKKHFLIQSYNISGILGSDFDVTTLNISYCSISTEINFNFNKIIIEKSTGQFSINLINYKHNLGNIVINSDSYFEILNDNVKLSIVAKKVTFHEDPLPFLALYQIFSVSLVECDLEDGTPLIISK